MNLTKEQKAMLKNGAVLMKLTPKQIDILSDVLVKEIEAKRAAEKNAIMHNDRDLADKLSQETMELMRILMRVEEYEEGES